jgi:DDE superfamily endonuclease
MPENPYAAALAWLGPLSSAFGRRTWRRVLVLAAGAILAQGPRTVASALRAAGLDGAPGFSAYHRVLSRRRWSGRAVSRLLLAELLRAFVAPGAPVVVGLDETLERRWGRRIAARGIYRDPVRSSHGHFAKASGLRWFSLMLLAPVPWAGRTWALPFLTALAPSEQYARGRGARHKKLTDWARQALLQLARWLPGRRIVAVADRSYAALELLHAVRRRVCVVARLRLDARLFDPPPPRTPRTIGRPRVVGARQPSLARRVGRPDTAWRRLEVDGWYGGGRRRRAVELATGTAVWHHTGLPAVPLRWVLVRDPAGRFEPQALLCTDLDAEPAEALGWFVRRWSVEVTFAEARRHLGVETQRQWSNAAVARTTPALLGLFSLVALRARELHAQDCLPHRRAAWYRKDEPTFSDTLAAVRRSLWSAAARFPASPRTPERVEVPRALLDRLTDVACLAA